MTLPPMPDSSYKFLLYAGILMLGFGFFQDLNLRKDYNARVNERNSAIDSLTLKKSQFKKEKEDFLFTAEILSKRYGIQNPITENDSVTSFEIIITGPKNNVLVSDSLSVLWRDYKNINFEIEQLSQRIDMSEANLKEYVKEFKEQDIFYIVVASLGLIFAFAGYAGLQKVQNFQERLMSLEISIKDLKYKHCQSCGKRFSSIVKNGHDNSGELNPAFCIKCFDKGRFLEPELTKQEFKERIFAIIKAEKSKKRKALLQKHFEDLERWKNEEYL